MHGKNVYKYENSICPKFRSSLYRGKKKRKLEVIFILVEGPRYYEATGENWHSQFLLVKSKSIIIDTRHGWDKLKNVYKYENRDCPKFCMAS